MLFLLKIKFCVAFVKRKKNLEMAEENTIEKTKLVLDFINKITPFDGKNQNCLPGFIERIDSIMPTINLFDNFNKSLLLGYIVDKITDEAKSTLMRHGNVKTWDEIKKILIKNHGEKLSPDILIDKIRYCRINTTIKDYYETINKYLCRLNNYYILNNDIDDGKLESNKRIALTTFKNNIPEPARSVIFSRKPESLDEAYEIILEGNYHNLGHKNIYNRQNNNNNKQFTQLNNNKQRNFNSNTRNNNIGNSASNEHRYAQNNQHFNGQYNSNQSRQFSQTSYRNNNYRNNNYRPTNNFRQQHQDRPEPMDISANENQNFQDPGLNNYPI